MFDLTENYAISRKLASQGMVLLKNENRMLPFKANEKIGVIGNECLELIKGGGGSAQVNCLYVRTLPEGLREKEQEGKIVLSEKSVERAANPDRYTVSELDALSGEMDKAIVTIRRFGSEGSDRRLGQKSDINIQENAYSGEADDFVIDDYEKRVGYFYPSNSELELLRTIEHSKIKEVVLILNISATMDISFIEDFPKIKAVLLTYLPGMECGTAIADVLCGDVNPSGRLADTITYNYEDYPSSACFDYNPDVTEYKEDIFVGYRYFETFAKEKVMFPFGYGLSYTTFEFSDYASKAEGDMITVSVNVKNVGNAAGREVVQVYTSSPAGLLKKPAIELRAFAKTKELQPGETEKLTISFKTANMASFDDTGVTGFKAAWVLEKGDYEILVGKSVRDTYSCGTYTVDTTYVTEQLTARFDGSDYISPQPLTADSNFGENKNITLYDVADGKATLQEFVSQLSVEDLITLAQGQPPAFPLGTAGIGNLKKYGVPNPQTADGPAGIRRSVNTTCFPCGTLIACSWDADLQYAMGKAMGYEGVSTGIDILLGPSMNIHRNPLCGRNFEYLSEDPLVAGKTAAAIVNGVQSQGLCATLKHFAANNCEYRRHDMDSIVSERALREIYLKGFEIAVKESTPAFIMSSYNKINGKHTSANPQLLTGVLRDEWHYEGAVMTDWRNHAPLDEEIIAGNNIKMPFGYPDQAALALESYHKGKLTLAQLQQNAIWVLKAVMKTQCFFKKDFGKRHLLHEGTNEISALEVNGISSTRILQAQREDGTWYLYHLGREQRGQRTFLFYVIDAIEEGEYTISAEISTNCPRTQIWYDNADGERLGTAYCDTAVDENEWYMVDAKIHLSKGENVLKVVLANEPDTEYAYEEYMGLPQEDIKLAKLFLKV